MAAPLLGGFGSSPFGSGGYGASSAVELYLVQAVAVRENAVRLTFNVPVRYTGVLGPNDASQVELYTVTPVEGSAGADGEPTRAVLPVLVTKVSNEDVGLASVVDVWVDRPFSPHPSLYQVQVTDLVDAAGDPIETTLSALQFIGVYRQLRPVTPEAMVANRDIANPQTLGGALSATLPNPLSASVLGTFPVDSTGDYAPDRGLESYRKRVLRRLMTRRGAFAHLPRDYGVSVPDHVKQLARPGVIEALAADAEEQIRQEPETVEVRVTTELRAGGVLVLHVFARTNLGDVQLDTTFKIGTG